VKGMNFVFGYSSPLERTGIVSMARLTQWEEGITPSRINERVLKETAHEIGHLGRLTHCTRDTCIMAYARTIDEVDRKLPMLCDGCRKNLKTGGR
jgi:archaemetzincin